MERLTQWFGFGNCRQAGIASHLEEKHTAEELVDILAARLAVYEDTEMEPCDYAVVRTAIEQRDTAKEHLSELIRLVGATGADNIRVMAEAHKEGRLLVLPCKVGDIVYGAETSPIIPLHVMELAVYLESAEGGDFEMLNNFGKTVFLTREEAEAALQNVITALHETKSE